MKYRETYVSAPLRKYISCVWHLTGDRKEAQAYGRQILIPNESVEVVFNFADSFPDTLHRQVSDSYAAYVVGPITKTGTTDFQGTIDLLGITFHPGMAFPFIQGSLEEMKNSIVPLTFFWKDLAIRFDELKIASSLPEKLTIIEQACFQKLEAVSVKQLDRLEYFFSGLNSMYEQASVQDLARTIGYSERTLERFFPLYAGLSPKEYLRIKRINNVAKTVLVDKGDIYDAIAVNGFVDYSHLVKELKHFGYTEFTAKPLAHTDFISEYLAH